MRWYLGERLVLYPLFLRCSVSNCTVAICPLRCHSWMFSSMPISSTYALMAALYTTTVAAASGRSSKSNRTFNFPFKGVPISQLKLCFSVLYNLFPRCTEGESIGTQETVSKGNLISPEDSGYSLTMLVLNHHSCSCRSLVSALIAFLMTATVGLRESTLVTTASPRLGRILLIASSSCIISPR